MICNKNHIVTLEHVNEAPWTDEESENPYGALKNMMYRLRGTLRKVWPVERGSCLLYEGCHELTKSLEHADRKGKVQVLSDLKELYQEPRELEKIKLIFKVDSQTKQMVNFKL